jgi:hypothetical protein
MCLDFFLIVVNFVSGTLPHPRFAPVGVRWRQGNAACHPFGEHLYQGGRSQAGAVARQVGQKIVAPPPQTKARCTPREKAKNVALQENQQQTCQR